MSGTVEDYAASASDWRAEWKNEAQFLTATPSPIIHQQATRVLAALDVLERIEALCEANVETAAPGRLAGAILIDPRKILGLIRTDDPMEARRG